jgi:nicotinate-nucleotide pyrophosphorylase (carboxylating)
LPVFIINHLKNVALAVFQYRIISGTTIYQAQLSGYRNVLTQSDIAPLVAIALEEDIGSGDITANLVSADERAVATVITRESGVLCGTQFVDAVFAAVDASLEVVWQKCDGDELMADDTLFTVSGAARSILTAERTALNFLQMLSGTASYSAKLAALVEGTSTRLLDTRKTIPGFRMAQKHAVACGGCHNHRVGLFDAFLIKENHIAACGGIREAVETARTNAPARPIEVEVESLDELLQALEASADRIMLDNFSLDDMRQAVTLNKGRAELEASGNVTEATLRAIADTGVDYISIGALTKVVMPLDLSLRLS